jgi:DNA-binding GntR family transcriptional regulator
MSPGATFERVYLDLKAQLASGAFAPGARLEPGVLSETLNSSVTPVRDALHRLVGERLVEAARHEGFRMPMITEAGLRHQYGWSADLLQLALRARRGAGAPGLAGLVDEADAQQAAAANVVPSLFLGIAGRASNPELAGALANLLDRLAPVRHVEPRIFADAAAEAHNLARAARDCDIARLRAALALYHRRRQRAAPELLEALLHADPDRTGQSPTR